MIPVRYAALDALPAHLRKPVIEHLNGPLEDRIAAVVTFRNALLRGKLPRPSQVRWPTGALLDTCLEGLARSGVAEVCAGSPEMTDEVVLTLVEAVLKNERMMEAACDHFVAMAIAERATACGISLPAEIVSDPKQSARHGRLVFSEDALAKVRSDARKLAITLSCQKAGIEIATWSEQVSAARELRELLAKCAPRGWGRGHFPLHALLRSDAAALREALRRLRELNDLIEELGRRMQSPLRSNQHVFESIVGELRRPIAKRDDRVVEVLPDVRGVERSDEIGRMLASEAVALTHPRLRWLWHARRAERGLLCYHAEGAGLLEVDESYGDGETPRPKPSDRGPILVCLDVSGSMDGAPGKIAQAVTLHLALAALVDKRPCHVFSFSGPGDVIEHRLADGGEVAIEGILTFLLLVFGGGTDVSEPLRRALDRHDEEREWKNADILLVTDGAFGVPHEIATRVAAEKDKSSLRVHGLIIGPYPLDAAEGVCTVVHRLGDWLKPTRG